MASDDHKLRAFDATGTSNCSGTPKVCTPRWTADDRRSDPLLAGRVQRHRSTSGSADNALHAYGLPPSGFGKSTLSGTSSVKPTASRFGPDGRLYVADLSGVIHSYTVIRDAANSYRVTATEIINLVRQIPNHDDDGTLESEHHHPAR